MPKRSNEQTLFTSKIFTVKSVDLDFNGQKHTYEYLDKNRSVMVIPLEDNHIYFVKEYFAAIDCYELCLPKGRLGPGHTPEQCAAKELQEEVGKKPQSLSKLATLSLSPGYNSQTTDIILATNLEDSHLEGDEPEPLEVHKIPFADIPQLITSGQLTESRSIAAIHILQNYLENLGKIQLNQMKFFGHHGFFQHEKEQGQDFLVDLTVYADIKDSSNSDKLHQTVDYGLLYEHLKPFFTKQKYDLIETLGSKIAESILKNFPVFKVEVCISKPQVPINGPLESASVTTIKYK